MADFHCPNCNHENESSAVRCWYCQALLPGDHTEVGEEASSGEKGEAATSDVSSTDHITDERSSTENPQQGDQADWLDKIRNLMLQDVSEHSTDDIDSVENHAHSEPYGLHEEGENTSPPAETSELFEAHTAADRPSPHEPAKSDALGVPLWHEGQPDWLQAGESSPVIPPIGKHADNELTNPFTVESSAFGSQLYTTQLKNAGLFSEILHEEPPDGGSGSHSRMRSGRNPLGRIVIGLILILAVLLPLLSQQSPWVIPAFYTQEIVDTLLVIEELPPDKPVLIAAQFEAGLAGELSWTFEAIVSHLISRGVPLTSVSTNAAANAILADMLDQAVRLAEDYPPQTKMVNLGYLPGGTVALSAFVRDPVTVAPYTADLAPAWELPALANVRSLADFSAILIVTDNPENVRAWVEQSGRVSAAPPLLVVSSAQAAPIIQPYYDSFQVAGYLSGAGGAATYQLLRQVAGNASNHYIAYQFVLLATALLVGLGGMLALILPQRADTDPKRSK